jgi:hypothetical protein
VPLRLLQNHLGNVEEREGAPSHLDLAGQRLYAFVIGHERQIQLGQRARLFTALLPARTSVAPFTSISLRTASSTGAAARRPAATALIRPARPSALTVWLAALSRPAFAARPAFATGGAWPTTPFATVGAVLAALVVGVGLG